MSTIFTRVGTKVKDAALVAIDAAKPRWHLIDAKDQVSKDAYHTIVLPWSYEAIQRYLIRSWYCRWWVGWQRKSPRF